MENCVQQYLRDRGYTVNEKAYTIIEEAGRWYRAEKVEAHTRKTVSAEEYELPRMGFAKRAAADDANLCEVIEINVGQSTDKNGEPMQGTDQEWVLTQLAANSFDTQYREQLELTSAEGTVACYVRLANAEQMTDGTVRGGEIRINYISASGFIPLTVENKEVLEAAFWGKSFADTAEEITLVICTLDDKNNYQYETVVFEKSGKVKAPAVLQTLGDVKPFAVMRTAEVNNIENMVGFGYPKVYGTIPVFQALDEAFGGFFFDVKDSKSMTFLNEKVCGFDEAGQPIPPNKELKRQFVFLGDKLPGADSLIKRDTPEIRVGSFQQSIEMLLSMMSLKFGYGTKKYSFENGQITTATEYIGERQDMMQELNKQRFQARQYIEGIIRALLWFDNTYNKANHDLEQEIMIQFDDSYIESKADRLESIRQDVAAGIGGKNVERLYLKEKYNLTDEDAAAWAGEDTEPADSEGGGA